MSTWQRKPTLEALNAMCCGTMMAHLDIRFIEVGEDHLAASMPVDDRTRQPFGLLHGGASVTLAETLGSAAAHFCLDPERFTAVGVEVNANHLRAVKSGTVTGVARALHLGGRIQVWEISIGDEDDRTVCVSRLTLAVVARG